MPLITELRPRELEPPETLDIHLPIGVHEDVGDLFVQKKRSDGPQVEGIVKEVLDQALLVRPRELDAGFREKLPSERLHLIATLPLVHVLEGREVELRDEGAVQAAPHLLEF